MCFTRAVRSDKANCAFSYLFTAKPGNPTVTQWSKLAWMNCAEPTTSHIHHCHTHIYNCGLTDILSTDTQTLSSEFICSINTSVSHIQPKCLCSHTHQCLLYIKEIRGKHKTFKRHPINRPMEKIPDVKKKNHVWNTCIDQYGWILVKWGTFW